MQIIELYHKFKKLPLGKNLFMKAVCLKAPYFSSIHPQLLEFSEGEIKIKLKKRRSVFNHIGTIHAIAMCNLAELCAGLAIDSAIPKNLRWIPKGMTVEYLKKAETSLIGSCKVLPENIVAGENQVEVNVYDKSDNIVFRAYINMYVSQKGSE